MGTFEIPADLKQPIVIDGQVGGKVMQDLTAYLVDPSVQELEFLIDLCERITPANCLTQYKISELDYWVSVDEPQLTMSGRLAAAEGVDRPFLETVRKRIRDRRAFEIQFWDGQPIDATEGSWSFSCRCIHNRVTGRHAFARFLIPLQASSEILEQTALEIGDNVEVFSGHGGLVFVYDPWLKEDTFNKIYAQARRFWGVDVEDLNGSLQLMKVAVKGVNWITIIGNGFALKQGIQDALTVLGQTRGVKIEQRKHSVILVAGPQPEVGDQHRPDSSMDLYTAVAKSIEPLFLNEHPDFPGERFMENVNTVGWIRRFIDPDGWR